MRGPSTYTTNIKGISSIQVHRELVTSQKAAWFLVHRLHAAREKGEGLLSGPVEAGEAYISGKRKNTSNEQRKELRGIGEYFRYRDLVAANELAISVST